jgi:hypothetical protein
LGQLWKQQQLLTTAFKQASKMASWKTHCQIQLVLGTVIFEHPNSLVKYSSSITDQHCVSTCLNIMWAWLTICGPHLC